MKHFPTVGLVLVLSLMVSAPAMAQGDLDASINARMHWAIEQEYVRVLEAMDCDELADEMDSKALGVLTLTQPGWLSPDNQYDWSDSVEKFGEEFAAHSLQARLALVAVIGLEKRCDGDGPGEDASGALVAGESDPNASTLARSHWGVSAEIVAELEAKDCSALVDSVDGGAWAWLSIRQPDWLSPDHRLDLSEESDLWLGDKETTASWIRALLSLPAVLATEMQCYPPTLG